MKVLIYFFISSLFLVQLNGQQSNDSKQSIISQAIFSEDGTLTISWIPKADDNSYRIQYRTDLTSLWQQEAVGVSDSFYTFPQNWDTPVEISITTESGEAASSYILAGKDHFEVDTLQNMLLIITDSIYNILETTISEYQEILRLEMIETEVIIVDNNFGVNEVKNEILENHSKKSLDYILLIGNVVVPYSGNSAIDGHTPDHNGAWVADSYYGEMDGNWTDFSVNNEEATRDANKNIPGDGKFDQSFIPSQVEVPVGRIDFSRLPKLEQDEIELTKKYIERNIAYRSGLYKATRRAIIDNNFNLAEGFAQGAIKSYHTFLEPDSINYGAFAQCYSQDYLFTFGAGGGSYQSASGITSTNALITDSIQSVFTTIFGSYFGDWDIENNLLRASLARGNSLINAWSGRPIWYFHHMSMGNTVGQVLLNTQNNNGNYTSQFGKSMAHISLLGDPSLKMYYHEAVSNVISNGQQIEWEYLAEDDEVVGFTIYYKENEEWLLIGNEPITDNFLNVSEIPFEGMTTLLIRPVGLIESRSGSYYNEGIGTTIDLIISNLEEEKFETIVYPNPANSFIIIESPYEVKEAVIVDMLGMEVKKTFGETQINIENLVSGVYLLYVNNDVIRFVKR